MKKFSKQYYLDFILSVIFIFTLGTTSISNNTYLNLTLKLVSVIFFGVITILRLKFIYEIKVKKVPQIFVTELSSPFFKKFITVSVLIIILLSVTLIYSHNTAYGIWKLLNLVLVLFPFLVLILINMNHKPKELYKIFVKVTEIFLVVGSLLIFFIEPFDYLGIEYKLSLERWSHVVFGRVSGFLFLFYFLHLLWLKEKVTVYNFLIIAVSGYSIYLTGLRAAIVGLIIIIPLILIVSFYLKRDLIRIAKLASVLVVVAVLGLLFTNSNESFERLGKISRIITTGQVDDGAVKARLDGWMVGWEMIVDSPFLGRGIGGYNSDFGGYEIQKLIKYLHNLFIELVVEFGLVGWVGLLSLIYFIVYYGRRIFLSSMYEREIRLHRKAVSQRQVGRRGEEENGWKGEREKGRNAGWEKRRKGDPASLEISFAETGWGKWRMGGREKGRKGVPINDVSDCIGTGGMSRSTLQIGEKQKGGKTSLSLNSHYSILIPLFFLVLFSLWLGMFSKDISSQSLLWACFSVFSWQLKAMMME